MRSVVTKGLATRHKTTKLRTVATSCHAAKRLGFLVAGIMLRSCPLHFCFAGIMLRSTPCFCCGHHAPFVPILIAAGRSRIRLPVHARAGSRCLRGLNTTPKKQNTHHPKWSTDEGAHQPRKPEVQTSRCATSRQNTLEQVTIDCMQSPFPARHSGFGRTASQNHCQHKTKHVAQQ